MSILPKLTAQDLACGDVLPTGPVCPWPKIEGIDVQTKTTVVTSNSSKIKSVEHDTIVKANAADMAKGLFKTAKQAVLHGRVSKEIREERYNTCKNCPHFIEQSKRCSECGCFMEAKTWVQAEPRLLCPKDKWIR